MYTQFADYVLRSADGALIPLDSQNSDYAEFVRWKGEGGLVGEPPAKTVAQRAAVLLAAVDAHLNAAAMAKGYDSILAASLRAALPSSAFHAEGVAFGTWMDAVYAKCYDLLAQVRSGEIEEPTRDELLSMLPALQLPE